MPKRKIAQIVLVVIVMIFSASVFPLQLVDDRGPFGLIDREGKIVVPPIYDHIGFFSMEGLAPVVLNGKAGYINPKGEIAVPIQFDSAGNFVRGLALVKMNGMLGYIDASGAFVIQPTLHSALWDDGANNSVRFFSEIGLAAAAEAGKWGYIDRGGHWAIPPQFDSAFPFSSLGYARVFLHGKGGIINPRGEIVLPIAFDLRGDVSENGLVPVQVESKVGYVRLDGQFAIYPRYVRAWAFGDDSPSELAQACDEDYCGFINSIGDFVGKFSRSEVDWFGVEPKYHDGGVVVRSPKTFKFGYGNIYGDIVIKPLFDAPFSFLGSDVAFVKKDGLRGYVNKKGEFSVLSLGTSSNGECMNRDVLERFEVDSKYGYKNLCGEVVIIPRFSWTDGFDQFGLARIRMSNSGR